MNFFYLIKLVILTIFLFGCEAIKNKSDEIVKNENEKLSKYIGKKSNDLKIDNRKELNLLLNILSYADGNNDLLDIAIKQNLNINELIPIFHKCKKLKLIKIL